MKVIVGIGVPGCGKTTYLKPLARVQGMTYLNADDIREELTGDPANHAREADVWRLMHERLEQALSEKDVVVDATYTKRRDRRELIEHARAAGATEIVGYWFDTPLVECLKRNQARERVVPGPVIANMHRRLHLNPPSTEEGFTRIQIIKGQELG